LNNFFKIIFAFAFCLLPLKAEPKPNVLFIAIDDLRPNLGCYGDNTAITPNFDRLASKGIVFDRAYCQLAVCSPSRISLMTGRRPDTVQVWDLDTHFREAIPDLVTLPQHFKNNGYDTRSIGKIYHGSGKPAKDPPSWSEDPIYDDTRKQEWRYASPENLSVQSLKRSATEGEDVPDNTFVDGLVCDEALIALDTFKTKQKPFFLGVGFRKPHLPFVAPKKYWDLYNREDIPKPVSHAHPEGAPEYATKSWNELEGYIDIPKDTSTLTAEKIQELRHGYYACISYIDAQIGRILDRLEALNLSGNTIICLWGDHGFHLGEQGLWTKANNYELSARVPLILSVPGQKNQGASSNAFVELVDLYPTLAELCELDIPNELEGLSMTPLLAQPDRPWKTAVFNQYPRMFKGVRHERHGEVMGYAVRTDHFRYVEWKEWESGKIVARELYDHQSDPEEMFNVADNIDQAATLFQHQRILGSGWKGALPLKSNF
jgi:iduronate 2-sulfatase